MHVHAHKQNTHKQTHTHTPPSPGEWCSPGSASDSRPSQWCSPHLCSPARGQRHTRSLNAFNGQHHITVRPSTRSFYERRFTLIRQICNFEKEGVVWDCSLQYILNGPILFILGVCLCACVPAACCATRQGCCTPSTPTGGPAAAAPSDDAWAPPTGHTVKGQPEKRTDQI